MDERIVVSRTKIEEMIDMLRNYHRAAFALFNNEGAVGLVRADCAYQNWPAEMQHEISYLENLEGEVLASPETEREAFITGYMQGHNDTVEVDRERLQSLLSTFLHYIQWAGGEELKANEKQFEEMSVLELQNYLQHRECQNEK